MTTRGVGVDGSLGAAAVTDLAVLVEKLEFQSFWFNAMAPEPDPISTLAQVLATTSTIEVGVGLLPIDMFAVDGLIDRLGPLGTALERVVLGIGAGQLKTGALAAIAQARLALAEALPGLRVALGGYGPKMLALAGACADAVNLSWMTPERAAGAVAEVAAGAAAAGRPEPACYLYVRVALGPDAAAELSAEMTAYKRWPVHRRNHELMGNPPYIGVALAGSADPADAAALAGYDGSWIPIYRPLIGADEDLDAWRAVVATLAGALVGL